MIRGVCSFAKDAKKEHTDRIGCDFCWESISAARLAVDSVDAQQYKHHPLPGFGNPLTEGFIYMRLVVFDVRW